MIEYYPTIMKSWLPDIFGGGGHHPDGLKGGASGMVKYLKT